jgi:hypothetical protein
MYGAMDLRFLFQRPGNTVTSVAAAAEVNPSTASRWKEGRSTAEWPQIVKLYARGLITDADLRAAGLAIPLPAKDEQLDVSSAPEPKAAVG